MGWGSNLDSREGGDWKDLNTLILESCAVHMLNLLSS